MGSVAGAGLAPTFCYFTGATPSLLRRACGSLRVFRPKSLGLVRSEAYFGRITHLGETTTCNMSADKNGQVAKPAEFSPMAVIKASASVRNGVLARSAGGLDRLSISSVDIVFDNTITPPTCPAHALMFCGVSPKILTSHCALSKAPTIENDSQNESGSFGSCETTTGIFRISWRRAENTVSFNCRGRPTFSLISASLNSASLVLASVSERLFAASNLYLSNSSFVSSSAAFWSRITANVDTPTITAASAASVKETASDAIPVSSPAGSTTKHLQPRPHLKPPYQRSKCLSVQLTANSLDPSNEMSGSMILSLRKGMLNRHEAPPDLTELPLIPVGGGAESYRELPMSSEMA